MTRKFLPVFSLDWAGLLKKLENVEGDFGILAPVSCYNKLLMRIRELNKPFFIDSSVFENQGYQYIALGGLLKADTTMPTGLKFGLSPQELDELLAWSRPEFVLGGLALTRLEVLRKHNVWADSTNWLWWDARYDQQRFGHRNALQESLG